MNAILRAATPQRSAAVQRARPFAVLMYCSESWRRWLWSLLYLLSAVAAFALPLFAKRRDDAAIVGAALLATGTACLWTGWLSRVVLLRLDAQRMRMPGVPRAIVRALLLAFAVTVLLPTLLMVVAGAPPRAAFGLLLAGAMGGLLFALLSSRVFALLCFVPWLLGTLATYVGRNGWSSRLSAYRPVPEDALWIGCALLALACWRWRALLRVAHLHGNLSWWREPIVAGRSQGAWWWLGAQGSDDANTWRAQIPDWLWPAGQIGDAGPAAPVRAMRAWLGTPFAPLAPRQWLIQWAIVPLAALAILALPAEGIATILRAAFVGGLFGTAFLATWMHGARLDVMRQRNAGEFAELALLPGWGDAGGARRILLAAITRSLVMTHCLLLLALCCVAAFNGLGARAWLLGILAWCGVFALSVLACLRPLAGRALRHPVVALPYVATLSLAMLSGFAMSSPASLDTGTWRGLMIAWTPVLAMLLTWNAGLWRRMQARPHPFLQD